MTFLSIIIALLLERITPQLIELRQFRWLRNYSDWMEEVLHIQGMGEWLGFVVLMLPPLILVWLLDGLFDNALFGLFELAFNVAVVFLCLGPRELDKEVDNYLDAIDIGDSQQQFTSASQLTREAPAVELGNQVVQVCKSIFVEANTRLYAVLFWFVLLGPVAVLAYRMIEQLLHACIMVHLSNLYRSLLGWIEWIPVHLTLFVYMISGSFEDGLEAFRKGTVSAVTLYEQNHELLQQVGYRAISPHDVLNQNHAMEMVRKSRGLVLRSLIVWLLFLLVLLLLG